jgi:AAA15 family ATPase/GTPase
VLIRFRTENFRSIKDEQELSLVASSLSDHPEWLMHAERYGLNLLRAAAVYGPNASGKSSLFHALQFMKAAVLESHRSWAPAGGVPRVPFALARQSAQEPSLFAVDLLLNGVRFEYGFTATSARITEEWLYAWPRGKRQEWFTRDASRDVEFVISRALPGENRAISALTRPNSLFLSAAAQNNHEVLEPLYRWFSEKLWVVDDSTRTYFEHYTIEQCKNESYRNSLFALLRSADLGLTGIEFRDDEASVDPAVMQPFGSDPAVAEMLRALVPRPRVQFRHGGSDALFDYALPYDQESRGTRTLFSLLGIVNWCLATGGTLAVDELDQSLHSHLAHTIVGMFNRPESNPHGAQLLFNSHDTNLLDGELLRRDQIWFTEKGYDGATRLFPLTDFHARKQENLERGYLQGRFGAVPAVGIPYIPGAGVG